MASCGCSNCSWAYHGGVTRQLTITLDDEMAKWRVFEPAPAQNDPFVVYARDLGARPDVHFDCAWKLLDDRPVSSF